MLYSGVQPCFLFHCCQYLFASGLAVRIEESDPRLLRVPYVICCSGKVVHCFNVLPGVNFLGYILENGLLSRDRVKLPCAVSSPHTKADMHSFLGWTNLDSQLHCNGLCPLCCHTWLRSMDWKHDSCIQRLEGCSYTNFTSAPALGLPDYNLSFHLFVHETNSFTSGLLVQKTALITALCHSILRSSTSVVMGSNVFIPHAFFPWTLLPPGTWQLLVHQVTKRPFFPALIFLFMGLPL